MNRSLRRALQRIRAEERGGFAPAGASTLADLTDVEITTTGDEALVGGQVLMYDAIDARWENLDEANNIVRLGNLQAFSDLVGVPDSWSGDEWYSVTSGSVNAIAGIEDHPGVVALTTGASATGFAIINSGSPNTGANQYYRDDGRMKLSALFRVPVLSDATQRFLAAVTLFGDRSDPGEEYGYRGTGANAVGVLYKDDENGGRFFLRCRTASVNTDTDLLTAVVANTWYLVEIQIRANGTLYDVWINGVKRANGIAPGVLIGNGPWTPYVGIAKTVGTTARTIQADFVNLDRRLATVRGA